MPRIKTALIPITALYLAGCALFLPDKPNVTAGDRLVVLEDSALQEMQGETLGKLDHRRLLRAQPGSVLPAGTIVRVVDRRDPKVISTGAGTSHADHNPWIYVQVVQSEVPAQVGWEGWIHYKTSAHEGRAAAPRPPQPQTLARSSKICPTADANDVTCALAVEGPRPVRVVGCVGQRVQIELWRDDGMYLTGFVTKTQFDGDPCGAVAARSER